MIVSMVGIKQVSISDSRFFSLIGLESEIETVKSAPVTVIVPLTIKEKNLESEIETCLIPTMLTIMLHDQREESRVRD